MIKTYEMIMDELYGYGKPKQKLGRLAKKGKYIPVETSLTRKTGMRYNIVLNK